MSALAALVATTSTLPALSGAGASTISNERNKAAILYRQIQSINSRVGLLGQKYDEAHVKLERFNNQIKNTKKVVAGIEGNVTKGNAQLRQDAIFAYVTNGSAASNNPLFSSHGKDLGATNVYNQLAEGNVSTTLANLKNYKIQLTKERWILANEDRQAAAAERSAARAFHEAQALQHSLSAALHQAKGAIATYIAQQQAAAAAKSRGILAGARQIPGFPAPPPNRVAAIAIRAAESYLGVPYVWGGASRRGVDCSGLIMLAYEAAGIFFPHYSGAQFADTIRVPLVDLQPGDLLFYGYNGDEHVSMYIGHGEMIEAPSTGYTVHITPVRLGYGFAGAGRPRA
jgi:cell wall-associated NlpC family hydrolase